MPPLNIHSRPQPYHPHRGWPILWWSCRSSRHGGWCILEWCHLRSRPINPPMMPPFLLQNILLYRALACDLRLYSRFMDISSNNKPSWLPMCALVGCGRQGMEVCLRQRTGCGRRRSTALGLTLLGRAESCDGVWQLRTRRCVRWQESGSGPHRSAFTHTFPFIQT